MNEGTRRENLQARRTVHTVTLHLNATGAAKSVRDDVRRSTHHLRLEDWETLVVRHNTNTCVPVVLDVWKFD